MTKKEILKAIMALRSLTNLGLANFYQGKMEESKMFIERASAMMESIEFLLDEDVEEERKERKKREIRVNIIERVLEMEKKYKEEKRMQEGQKEGKDEF